MTEFKTISFLILTILFLTSCDPAKLLIIRADSKNNTSVSVYTNNKIIPFGNEVGNKEDTTKMIIQVPFDDTTKRTFNYGIGNWPNNAITELVTNIDSVIINNSKNKIVLRN